MEVLRIRGGLPLSGRIAVSGAKNAALPIFAAALLTEDTVTIENVPDLSDLKFMADIMRHLGAEIEQSAPGTYKIKTPELKPKAPYDLVRKMRASVCLMGPLIGRLKRCEVSMPGGCVIGPRPIDLHLKGFKKLGCDVDTRSGYILIDASHAKGSEIFLGGRHGSTVTGTANILMAAVLLPGITRIESAACEPEIVDLCNMLVKMGAIIEGIGSHVLTIEGVKRLKGCKHSIIPDRIEAGTLVIGAAMCGSNVTVEGISATCLGALMDKLEEAGVPCESVNGPGNAPGIHVRGSQRHLRPVDVITLPYPGFPTDLQAQICAMLTLAPGLSVITEKVYPNRFMHVPELCRMGADIAVEGPSAIIKGVRQLSGAPVMASDLRASAALVLAGLAAQGETWVQRIYHLDRGYDRLDEKLKLLGADIARLPASELPKDLIEE